MTDNKLFKFDKLHPLHSALLGAAVYAGTNNAMYALGATVGSYVYMQNFGHSLLAMGNVGETGQTTKPATHQPKITQVFHRMEFKNPYQKSAYQLHIDYKPELGSVM